jgi:hypothetical protein
MGERIQPGGRVDRETYEQFKQFVKNQYGSVRGNLGRELEKAMSERMSAAKGPDTLTRIENDVATIKAVVADAEHDGGESPPTVDSSESARARSTNDTDKPAPNQPRGEKIDWIIETMGLNNDSGSVHPDALRNMIESEYNFKDSTVNDYIDAIVTKLSAVQIDDDVYYWGSSIENRREELRSEADEEMDVIA